jgi:L-cysteine S-thiosulfotransferase
LPFPSLRLPLAVALATAGLAVHAAAEDVRQELTARIEAQLQAAAAQAPAVAPPSATAAAAAPAGGPTPLERGKALWGRRFKDGRSLASCYPNGGRRVAASYPLYDSRLKRVVTLEMSINQCLKIHREPLLEATDPQTMGALAAYLRSLADGRKVAVRVPAAGESHFEQGRRLYFTRFGQRNYACASCHVQNAGRIYADQVLSGAIGQATRWPFIRANQAYTLQAQIRDCLDRMGAAPFGAGSGEMNDLEYFLTYLSLGQPLTPNTPR